MILRNWPKTERYAFGNIWQQLDVFASTIIDELDDGRVSGRTPRIDKPQFGLSLVEVLVALGLVTVSLFLVLALIPTGLAASRQASQLQSALAWSRHLVETAPLPKPSSIQPVVSQHQETLGQVDFQAQRTVTALSPTLASITVQTTWPGNNRPLVLTLERYHESWPSP